MADASTSSAYPLPDRPSRRSRLTFWPAMGLMVLGALAFLGDLIFVATHATAAADRTLILDVHHGFPRSARDTMLLVSLVGGPTSMAIVAALAALFFLLRRSFAAAFIVLAGVAGAELVETLIKRVVARPRPHLWTGVPVEHSYSFPSGHATAIMATACAICFACALTGNRGLRLGVAIAGGVAVALVGFSRVYLGVHWPSDVVGGDALALAWVSLVYLVTLYAMR